MAFSGRAHELENDLGVLLAMQGKFDAAQEAFERGLRSHPGDLPLQINRALIEADLGRPEIALDQLTALTEKNPTDFDCLGNLSSLLLETGRKEKSLKVARRMCTQAPFDPRGYYLSGRALYEQDRYEDAEEALERAARLDPFQVDTLIALGLCHAAVGRRRECVQVLERARSLAPNDPDVLYNLGLAYEDAASEGGGHPSIDSAIALYRRVLDLAPTYKAARDRLDALEEP
jgi:tetratricopeptide (TPR) repeat protein